MTVEVSNLQYYWRHLIPSGSQNHQSDGVKITDGIRYYNTFYSIPNSPHSCFFSKSLSLYEIASMRYFRLLRPYNETNDELSDTNKCVAHLDFVSIGLQELVRHGKGMNE